MSRPLPSDLVQLRQHIEMLEGTRCANGVLPFGVQAIDACLPGGGLLLGAVHEIAGQEQGAIDGAAAALFAAGIAARTGGKVLWCATHSDLFAPGLALAGLSSSQVIHAETSDEKQLLGCVEEGLRHGGLGAVVGEVAKFSLIASRRLQLAAEASGTPGLIVRRWSSSKAAAEFGQPTSAVTRWRISTRPSLPLPVQGVGRTHWYVELLRCKGGKTAVFDVEAGDGKACLALAAPLVHGPAAAPVTHIRAAS